METTLNQLAKDVKYYNLLLLSEGGGLTEFADQENSCEYLWEAFVGIAKLLHEVVQACSKGLGQLLECAKIKTSGTNQTKTSGPNRTKTNGTNRTKTNGTNRTKTNGTNQTKTSGTNQTKTSGTNQTKTSGTNQTKTSGTNQTLDILTSQVAANWKKVWKNIWDNVSGDFKKKYTHDYLYNILYNTLTTLNQAIRTHQNLNDAIMINKHWKDEIIRNERWKWEIPGQDKELNEAIKQMNEAYDTWNGQNKSYKVGIETFMLAAKTFAGYLANLPGKDKIQDVINYLKEGAASWSLGQPVEERRINEDLIIFLLCVYTYSETLDQIVKQPASKFNDVFQQEVRNTDTENFIKKLVQYSTQIIEQKQKIQEQKQKIQEQKQKIQEQKPKIQEKVISDVKDELGKYIEKYKYLNKKLKKEARISFGNYIDCKYKLYNLKLEHLFKSNQTYDQILKSGKQISKSGKQTFFKHPSLINLEKEFEESYADAKKKLEDCKEEIDKIFKQISPISPKIIKMNENSLEKDQYFLKNYKEVLTDFYNKYCREVDMSQVPENFDEMQKKLKLLHNSLYNKYKEDYNKWFNMAKNSKKLLDSYQKSYENKKQRVERIKSYLAQKCLEKYIVNPS